MRFPLLGLSRCTQNIEQIDYETPYKSKRESVKIVDCRFFVVFVVVIASSFNCYC